MKNHIITLICGLLFLNCITVKKSFGQKTLIRLPGAPSLEYGRFTDLYFTDELTGWIYNGDIYKTSDGGSSWIKQTTLMGTARSLEFINADTGFAGTLSGFLHRTFDGGATWITKSDTNLFGSGFCGMSHIGNKLFACGTYFNSPKFFYSNNLGDSWNLVRLDSLARYLVDCHFIDSNNGFLTGTGKNPNGTLLILRTRNGGKNWEIAYERPATAGSYIWKIYQLDSANFFASVQGTSGGNSLIVKSVDGGETWYSVVANIHETMVQGICFETPNEGWIGGWFNGVYHTVDGGATWKYLPFGRNINRFFRLPNGRILAAGSSVYEISDYVTSAEELSPQQALHSLNAIFPNPSRADVKISLSIAFPTNVTLNLFSSSGELVHHTQKSKLSKGEHLISLDIKNLDGGTFHLVILTDEIHLAGKLIVEK